MKPQPRILVVGAGITGVAAAEILANAGLSVAVHDMGENPGGRLAVRDLANTSTQWDGHIVDVGAAYFTVSDAGFAQCVATWQESGLVRPWFDTCTVVESTGTERRTGPLRWATAQGLRSVVRAQLQTLTENTSVSAHFVSRVEGITSTVEGVAVTFAGESEPQHFDAVVVACPDPQALRVLRSAEFPELTATLQASIWQPIISETLVFDARMWSDDDFWFVNDSPTIASIADDGRRRGDDAAVLVAHSTPELAQQYYDNPASAAPLMQAEVARVLGISMDIRHNITKRWGLAHPGQTHGQHFGVAHEGRVVVCGDSWGERPRIESAWLSGRAAARAVVAALG